MLSRNDNLTRISLSLINVECRRKSFNIHSRISLSRSKQHKLIRRSRNRHPSKVVSTRNKRKRITVLTKPTKKESRVGRVRTLLRNVRNVYRVISVIASRIHLSENPRHKQVLIPLIGSLRSRHNSVNIRSKLVAKKRRPKTRKMNRELVAILTVTLVETRLDFNGRRTKNLLLKLIAVSVEVNGLNKTNHHFFDSLALFERSHLKLSKRVAPKRIAIHNERKLFNKRILNLITPGSPIPKTLNSLTKISLSSLGNTVLIIASLLITNCIQPRGRIQLGLKRPNVLYHVS